MTHMPESKAFALTPIGFVRSSLTDRKKAPKQSFEGSPNAWLELTESVEDGLLGIAVGQEVILITWFHEAERDVLQVHPRSDPNLPLTGVFLTRSPDRPNPLGLHRVRVLAVSGRRLEVGPLEAIDGTPVVDIKPMLGASADS